MFLFLEMFLVFQIDRGKLIVMFTNVNKSHKKIDVTENMDIVLSDVQSARQRSFLHVFVDNQVVNKMIIKGPQ